MYVDYMAYEDAYQNEHLWICPNPRLLQVYLPATTPAILHVALSRGQRSSREGAHWKDVLIVSENIGDVLTPRPALVMTNPELSGVFTVDWNQPASDASKLIRNAFEGP